MKRSLALLTLGLCCLSEHVAAAEPERVMYTIAVGHNDVPPTLRRPGSVLATLRYADDDALQVYSFLRHASREAFLLSVLDADTQRDFPEVVAEARPPTLATLEQTVEHLRAAMLRDRAAGRQPVLFFFYSGHGTSNDQGEPSLALLDAGLTQDLLYSKVLSRLPVEVAHVVVDACHAESVVRPRDAEASVEVLSEAEREAYIDSTSLAQFPQVGAVLASTASAQTFEWDAYRGGVFAHELLSGIRGAADVNHDGRIEYSELGAFLAAANQHVKDPRARLAMVIQPPRANLRAPLVDLGRLTRHFSLTGRAEGAWARSFFIENERGVRLLDVFPEPSTPIRLRLPIAERLFLVRGDSELELIASEGSEVRLESRKLNPARSRARGGLDDALRLGLFATPFGPGFYRGYVGERAELVSVPLGAEPTTKLAASPPLLPLPLSPTARPSANRPTLAATALLIGAGVSSATAAIFAGLSLKAKSDYEQTSFERSAAEARDRYDHYRTWAWIAAGAAGALAGTGIVLLALPARSATGAAPRSQATLSVTADGFLFAGRFE